MEFDEKELRREISYAIKNIHGIRHVLGPGRGAELWGSGGLALRPSEGLKVPNPQSPQLPTFWLLA
jgi:hypothetical protein